MGRIKDLNSALPSDNDALVFDGSNGTRKISYGEFKSDLIANTLSSATNVAASVGLVKSVSDGMLSTQRTITMDCNTASVTLSGWYVGQYQISGETWYQSGMLIVPLYARKSGYDYPIIVGYENGSVRLLSPTSLAGVTVGLLTT